MLLTEDQAIGHFPERGSQQYVTLTSPYARMVRIVIREKFLEGRVEVIQALTRKTDSPYYSINPSGRVPYLIHDDGVAMEDSQLICAYLDHLDGAPIFDHPLESSGWESRRLEALARSLMESLCVWGRVLALPEGERSPTVIEHERQRSKRLTNLWESEINHPLLNGEINLIQITLVCALQLDRRNNDNQWRPDHPKLSSWANLISERASIADTLPPIKQK
jgi:glutathione S-transferase